MKWLVLVLFSCIQCAVLTAAITEGNLHALLVCDTSAYTLRESYLVDLTRMKRNVEGIAYQSNLQLNLRVLTDNEVSAKGIQEWIASLPRASNDVALVYYVGREGHPPKAKGHWPSIMPAREGKRGFITAGAVAKAIQKQHPRLTLVFFDCYEHLMKISSNRIAIASNEKNIPTSGDFSEIKPLFTEAKGTFIACSGPKDRKGYGIVQGRLIGGVFTSALIDSFVFSVYGPLWVDSGRTLKSYYRSVFRPKRKQPLIHRRVIEPHNEIHHFAAKSFVPQEQ